MRRVSEEVTRHPRIEDGEDTQGNTIEKFGADEQHGIYDFDPGGSVVQVPGREAVITTPTIYMPTPTPFNADDQCTVRGKRYTVEGEPREWLRHRPGPNGAVVKLRRVDG